MTDTGNIFLAFWEVSCSFVADQVLGLRQVGAVETPPPKGRGRLWKLGDF